MSPLHNSVFNVWEGQEFMQTHQKQISILKPLQHTSSD